MSDYSASPARPVSLFTIVFVAWVTVVNLLYLLMQVVIAADDCSVPAAATRVMAFLRRERRHIVAVFLIVLAIVVAATGASVLATAALGLIAFVPFLWLVVVPLQLIAWLLRAVVFQFIGLASIGAYLKLYRASGDVAEAGRRYVGAAVPWAPTGAPERRARRRKPHSAEEGGSLEIL